MTNPPESMEAVNKAYDVEVHAPAKPPPPSKAGGVHKILLACIKEKDARMWFLVSTFLVFVLSYSLVFVVFYKLRNDWDHMFPWIVTSILSIILLSGAIFKMYLETSEFTGEFTPLHTQDEIDQAVEGQAPGGKFRNPKLDYLKLAVNLLVVVHHIIDTVHCEAFYHTDLTSRVFTKLTQSFMMQSMTFCSGFVYTPVENDSKAKTILQLLMGYLVVQVMYLFCLKYTVMKEHPTDGFSCFYVAPALVEMPIPPDLAAGATPTLPLWKIFQDLPKPFYHLWYIYALIVWRLVIPYWMRFKQPVMIAIALAILTGFTDSDNQAIFRTLGYFPYFVMGVVMKDHMGNIMQLVNKPEVKIFAVAIFTVNIFFAITASQEYLCDEFFQRLVGIRTAPCTSGISRTGDWNQEKDISNYWISMWALLATYFLSPPLILAAMAIMPNGDYPLLRAAGERTLAPYIFHVVALMFIRAYTDFSADFQLQNMIPLFVSMTVVTFVLYIPMVDRLLRPIALFPLEELGLLKAKQL